MRAHSAGFPIPQVSSRALFRENKLYFLGQEAPEGSRDLWGHGRAEPAGRPDLIGMTIDSFDISRDSKQIAFAAIGSTRSTAHGGTPPENAILL